MTLVFIKYLSNTNQHQVSLSTIHNLAATQNHPQSTPCPLLLIQVVKQTMYQVITPTLVQEQFKVLKMPTVRYKNHIQSILLIQTQKIPASLTLSQSCSAVQSVGKLSSLKHFKPSTLSPTTAVKLLKAVILHLKLRAKIRKLAKHHSRTYCRATIVISATRNL